VPHLHLVDSGKDFGPWFDTLDETWAALWRQAALMVFLLWEKSIRGSYCEHVSDK
jgi:hypothetical protein